MKRDSLQVLAAYGVHVKLKLMERELRELFRDFPEAFASPTPPILARPERKPNGQDWPTFEPPSEDAARSSNGAWTPERRAAAAQRQRARQSAAPWGAAQRQRARQSAAPWGSKIWHRLHDYLKDQPAHTARAIDIIRALGITAHSSLTSAIKNRPELFRNVHGQLTLTRVVDPNASAAPATPPKKKRVNTHAAKQPWGTFGWQRAHDYLKGVKDREAPLADIMKHAKINSQASFLTGVFDSHPDLFARVGKKGSGQYKLKKIQQHA